MNAAIVYLALGSNLGDRRANLLAAIDQLKQQVTVEQVSSIYETEPAYITDQPRFYNMVLRGSTHLAPDELLHFVKSIEQRMGREHGQRYGPRTIDIDILAYGILQLVQPGLIIPHPGITERAFVLTPLAEIAPDLVLPGQHASVATLAQRAGSEGQVVRMVLGKIS
jgi:2-amino-4-hydroxy-6-hydroxymethyldihydropteridine diphosphokinase